MDRNHPALIEVIETLESADRTIKARLLKPRYERPFKIEAHIDANIITAHRYYPCFSSILIKKGRGYFLLEEKLVGYWPGRRFNIPPCALHAFMCGEKEETVFIRQLEIYFKGKSKIPSVINRRLPLQLESPATHRGET